jgi:hypothetical protein
MEFSIIVNSLFFDEIINICIEASQRALRVHGRARDELWGVN